MEKQHIDILLKGNIRNIGFAFQTLRAADKLQISGYIKYMGSDTVKIAAEGKTESLDAFVGWCKAGVPEAGNVNVQVTANSVSNYKQFTIIDNQIINSKLN